MKSDIITVKNQQTGKTETIKVTMTRESYGIKVYVNSEQEAYRLAYEYRKSNSNVDVHYAHNAQQWMVRLQNKVDMDVLARQSVEAAIKVTGADKNDKHTQEVAFKLACAAMAQEGVE